MTTVEMTANYQYPAATTTTTSTTTTTWFGRSFQNLTRQTRSQLHFTLLKTNQKSSSIADSIDKLYTLTRIHESGSGEEKRLIPSGIVSKMAQRYLQRRPEPQLDLLLPYGSENGAMLHQYVVPNIGRYEKTRRRRHRSGFTVVARNVPLVPSRQAPLITRITRSQTDLTIDSLAMAAAVDTISNRYRQHCYDVRQLKFPQYASTDNLVFTQLKPNGTTATSNQHHDPYEHLVLTPMTSSESRFADFESHRSQESPSVSIDCQETYSATSGSINGAHTPTPSSNSNSSLTTEATSVSVECSTSDAIETTTATATVGGDKVTAVPAALNPPLSSTAALVATNGSTALSANGQCPPHKCATRAANSNSSSPHRPLHNQLVITSTQQQSSLTADCSSIVAARGYSCSADCDRPPSEAPPPPPSTLFSPRSDADVVTSSTLLATQVVGHCDDDRRPICDEITTGVALTFQDDTTALAVKSQQLHSHFRRRSGIRRKNLVESARPASVGSYVDYSTVSSGFGLSPRCRSVCGPSATEVSIFQQKHNCNDNSTHYHYSDCNINNSSSQTRPLDINNNNNRDTMKSLKHLLGVGKKTQLKKTDSVDVPNATATRQVPQPLLTPSRSAGVKMVQFSDKPTTRGSHYNRNKLDRKKSHSERNVSNLKSAPLRYTEFSTLVDGGMASRKEGNRHTSASYEQLIVLPLSTDISYSKPLANGNGIHFGEPIDVPPVIVDGSEILLTIQKSAVEGEEEVPHTPVRKVNKSKSPLGSLGGIFSPRRTSAQNKTDSNPRLTVAQYSPTNSSSSEQLRPPSHKPPPPPPEHQASPSPPAVPGHQSALSIETRAAQWEKHADDEAEGNSRDTPTQISSAVNPYKAIADHYIASPPSAHSVKLRNLWQTRVDNEIVEGSQQAATNDRLHKAHLLQLRKVNKAWFSSDNLSASLVVSNEIAPALELNTHLSTVERQVLSAQGSPTVAQKEMAAHATHNWQDRDVIRQAISRESIANLSQTRNAFEQKIQSNASPRNQLADSPPNRGISPQYRTQISPPTNQHQPHNSNNHYEEQAPLPQTQQKHVTYDDNLNIIQKDVMQSNERSKRDRSPVMRQLVHQFVSPQARQPQIPQPQHQQQQPQLQQQQHSQQKFNEGVGIIHDRMVSPTSGHIGEVDFVSVGNALSSEQEKESDLLLYYLHQHPVVVDGVGLNLCQQAQIRTLRLTNQSRGVPPTVELTVIREDTVPEQQVQFVGAATVRPDAQVQMSSRQQQTPSSNEGSLEHPNRRGGGRYIKNSPSGQSSAPRRLQKKMSQESPLQPQMIPENKKPPPEWLCWRQEQHRSRNEADDIETATAVTYLLTEPAPPTWNKTASMDHLHHTDLPTSAARQRHPSGNPRYHDTQITVAPAEPNPGPTGGAYYSTERPETRTPQEPVEMRIEAEVEEMKRREQELRQQRGIVNGPNISTVNVNSGATSGLVSSSPEPDNRVYHREVVTAKQSNRPSLQNYHYQATDGGFEYDERERRNDGATTIRSYTNNNHHMEGQSSRHRHQNPTSVNIVSFASHDFN